MDLVEEEFIKKMSSILDERTRRIFLGGCSTVPAFDNISRLSKCTGISRTTITKGAKEYAEADPSSPSPDDSSEKRVRKPGAGRKCITDTYPQIQDILYSFMDGNTKAYPNSPLCWTLNNIEAIKKHFSSNHISISTTKIRQLLNEMDFDIRKYDCSSADEFDKIQTQYDFIRFASHSFLKKNLPVVYLDINPTNPDTQSLAELTGDAVSLWWRNRLRCDTILPNSPFVMIVLGSHSCNPVQSDTCAAITKKISSDLRQNILLSILPGGISKWMYANQIISLYSGLIEIFQIDTPVKHMHVDTETTNRMISQIIQKIPCPDMNFFCRNRKSL